jgi:hypothetical protein
MDSGVQVDDVHPTLFDFQQPIVKWLLAKGRACLFAGTGLGKTIMQTEYTRHIPGRRLIVAPLAVAGQTIAEANRMIGLEVNRVNKRGDIGADGVYIVNYDRLEECEGVRFEAVVLDESGILKNHVGSTREYIQNRFRDTPYRLACTATPAPNDYMELGTHAEFVGAMTRAEMLATFFVHDGGDTSQWRLKRHAVNDFWKWVSSWAIVVSHPRDLGFDTIGYDLPELRIHEHLVYVDGGIGGGLFGDTKVAATNLSEVLRGSITERVAKAVDVLGCHQGSVLIWCNIDAEQDALEKAFPEAVSVRGSDTREQKEDRLLGFADGKYRMLITKPKIAGYGMNWQRCHCMAFVGVTYSFEQVYQAIRRCWRFGQTMPVDVHMITCNAEDSVMSALRIKDAAHQSMTNEMRRYCRLEVA